MDECNGVFAPCLEDTEVKEPCARPAIPRRSARLAIVPELTPRLPPRGSSRAASVAPAYLGQAPMRVRDGKCAATRE
ncbi:unnamed protein product [Lampetra fluviatilis]